MAATLQTLRFLDEHPERCGIDEAALGQVDDDRVRPHGGSLVDPALDAYGGVQVEFARHRHERQLAREAGDRRVELVQEHIASL